MIPILYPRGETAFTSGGLGRLAECISCKVTEELSPGGSYECTLEIPYNARLFNSIITSDEYRGGAIIYTTPAYGKDPQPFDIYRVTMTNEGIATVNAKHISRRLNNIILQPYDKPQSSGYLDVKTNAILANAYNTGGNPFTFEIDNAYKYNYGTGDLISAVPVNAMQFLAGGDAPLYAMIEADGYLGEYEWNKWTVKLLKRRGSATPIKAKYGVNVVSFNRYTDINDTYNAVVPYYSRDDVTVIGGIVRTSNIADVPRAVDLTSEFDETPTASELEAKAQEMYFPNTAAGLPVMYDDMQLLGGDENISINLLQTPDNTDFTRVGYAQLGDYVDLDYTPFNWTYTGARVVKLTYDSMMERNDSVTISKSTQSERTYGDIIRASM